MRQRVERAVPALRVSSVTNASLIVGLDVLLEPSYVCVSRPQMVHSITVNMTRHEPSSSEHDDRYDVPTEAHTLYAWTVVTVCVDVSGVC